MTDPATDAQRASLLLNALLADRQLALVEQGSYLRGRCPQCEQKELFISAEKPWQLKCGRLNNCGYEESTRSRYRHIFDDFSEKFPASDQHPNATADAYLQQNRGFDLAVIGGCYQQALSRLRRDKHSSPVACETVRFALWDGHYWERVLDEAKARLVGKKAHLSYGVRYAGRCWMLPGTEIAAGAEVWVVEGIFHALALAHVGITAVAAIAASNFPWELTDSLQGQGITWVLAYDDDKAGNGAAKKYGKKLIAKGETVEIALAGAGQDWDDIYRRGALDDKFIEAAKWRGRLFGATDITSKACAFYAQKHLTYFLLDFESRLYAISVSSETLNRLLDGAVFHWSRHRDEFGQSVRIEPISNFLPTFIYAEYDEILDEQRYVFSVEYCSGQPPGIVALDGGQIDSPTSFHKAMLTNSLGGTFDGSAKALKILRDRWFNHKIKVVSSIPYLGYEPKSGAYVYPHFAFYRGQMLDLNDQGFFDIGKSGIKTSFRGFSLVRGGDFRADWFDDFLECFSWQGLAALAYWLGSLFVQQIRKTHKSFPFLELTGEAGAGKSTLIEFLWRLCGREDYEGFDAMKASNAGRRRAFAQASNLPLVLIESDRGDQKDAAKQKQFDFDEFKPLYNGRALGTLGIAKRGHDTEEPLFQGALVFAQNAEVEGSEALLQRIVHCHCSKEHFTAHTLAVAPQLETLGVDQLAGFLPTALGREDEILTTYQTGYAACQERFYRRGDIKTKLARLVKNHAQVVACAQSLPLLIPQCTQQHLQGLEDYLYRRAISRQHRLADDHPLVQRFWEVFEYLNRQPDPDAYDPGATREVLNHSGDSHQIAINLNHLQEAARHHGQGDIDIPQLKKLLPASRRQPFVGTDKVWSAVLKKAVHCWIFRKT